MTVENTISKTGKQVMGSFTYDFSFDELLKDPTEEVAKQAIKCAISDGTTETILTYGTDYSVALNSNRKGGQVTVVNKRSAAWTITIYRSYEATQGADYNDFDAFPAETLEQCLDKVTMLIQEIKEELTRCVKVTVTGNQTPEQLLAEVYSKLDSATAIAAQAIAAANTATTAANNATAAVESAEQTLEEVTEYVDAAKSDINTTKAQAEASINATASSATSTINSTKDTAVSTVNAAVTAAEGTIDDKVDAAEASIDQTIADAVDEVTAAALAAAQEAIADATETVTATATANLNDYVDNTVEPSLQSYVTAAQSAQTAAAGSATTANGAASSASSSAAAALASEQNSLTNKNATLAALDEALELTGYAEIFGGYPNDGTDDEIVGGYIQ